MKTVILALTLSVGLMSAAQATGAYTCEAADKAEWLTKAALTEKLEAEGWKVRFIKPDGGCWEVYGTNADGKRVEGYFHPKTGEKLLVSQRGKILFRADTE